MKRSLVLSAALLAALLEHGHAQTLTPDWGMAASAQVAGLRNGGLSFIPYNTVDGHGGFGANADTATVTESRGTATAAGQFGTTGDIGLPTLSASATSNPGTNSAAGWVTAIDAYTYLGSGPKTFFLDVVLDGSFTDAGGFTEGFAGSVSIWSETPRGEADPLPAPDAYFPAYLERFGPTSYQYHEAGGEVTYLLLAGTELSAGGITPDDDAFTGTLSWTMNPGDTVHLGARLAAEAYGTNASQSIGSLTMALRDTAGLSAASAAAVPEPSAVLLGSIGLAGLLVIRRGKGCHSR
ncbi:PEP-CTERM sorting domain-containing protein [Luteolibacter arcticus]|uniref:PEP-CTERM sorting domain-containing protein n=1 Tax=Luteolibacter arcticus TaxID=1581411 RepID=A0ABT3GDQ8_9BACT|nr:PEP-CTERM sorting domain-containing protein [Luteolibacter arcticus]MCW1921758.1 PEP-CTERM sorting domain-containing protein [Luteolibacter arcticus]